MNLPIYNKSLRKVEKILGITKQIKKQNNYPTDEDNLTISKEARDKYKKRRPK